MTILGSRANLENMNDPSSPHFDAAENQARARTTKRRIFVNTEPHVSYIDPKTKSFQVKYLANKVKTNKYSILTFIPKNLMEQFRGIANFYFLMLVVLQAFDMFKTVDIVVTAAPIVIIVFATALKVCLYNQDAIEDIRRFQADSTVNHSLTYTLFEWNNVNYASAESKWYASLLLLQKRLNSCFERLMTSFKTNPKKNQVRDAGVASPLIYPPFIGGAAYKSIEDVKADDIKQPGQSWGVSLWKDVKVGDFVFLRNQDRIPADIMIVATSESDSLCYVETKNLDGETNLKIKRGINELAHVSTPEDCTNVHGYIDVESPSPSLYTFSATFSIYQPSTGGLQESTRKDVSIGPTGLLLRGCVLRNTRWLVGIVAYTGADTKIMLNSGERPSKRSRVDKQLNPHILLNFAFLACLCLICGVNNALTQTSYIFELAPFVGINTASFERPFVSGLISFFNCLIIFQNLIPIALYISLEATKSIQVQSFNESLFINKDVEMYDEESGKFAEPKSWNLCDDLGQIEYIFSDKTGTLTSNMMEFRKASICGQIYGRTFSGSHSLDERNEMLKKMMDDLSKKFATKHVGAAPSFVDPHFATHLDDPFQSQKIREFFTLLSLCHTVLIQPTKQAGLLVYNAQSPDEAALVSAARDVGFAFTGRDQNDIQIDVMNISRTYRVLQVMEFNSDRKRMSVILRRPEGQILLLCKGADSVIYERLSEDNDSVLIDKTMVHLSKFANEGLRTLCLAYRMITEEEYTVWAAKYSNAQNEIEDREKKCQAVAELIEKDLMLMGATAIEDKLQTGVPESIKILSKAGIKIWILTGDKLETAINIGFSCNLLSRTMVLIVIQSTTKEDTIKQLKEALTRFWTKEGLPVDNQTHAFITDGDSLKYGLDDDCKELLLELACRCKAVICCRVSPLQKAMVVKLVRVGLGAMCLAIGDGANDVSMIQEADIGIGINGKEGLQAVMASDYAISQFQFLSRLVLVHGKWAYIRSSSLVLNYFYKNVVWLMILFWHQFFSGFTAALITDFTYSMFFNTVFTFLPTLFVGIFEQDMNDKISLLVPQIYEKGIRQELYSTERYWIYVAHAIFQSFVCYYGAYYMANENIMNKDGYDIDLASLGTLISFGAIIVINIFSVGCWNRWTFITHIAFWGDLVIFLAYVMSYSAASNSAAFGIPEILFKSPIFYFGITFIITICLLPRLLISYIQIQFYPTDTDIIQEIQALHKDFNWECTKIQHHNSAHMTTNDISISSFAVKSHVDDTGKLKSSLEALNTSQIHDKKKKKRFPSFLALSDNLIDGFGVSSVLKRRVPRSPTDATEEVSTRPPSASSSIGVAFKKATKLVKRFTMHQHVANKINRNTSLVYMGAKGGLVCNTGFAFSHDTGMVDVVAPTRELPIALEDQEKSKKFSQNKGRNSSIASLALKSISARIQSVIHHVHAPSSKGPHPLPMSPQHNNNMIEPIIREESVRLDMSPDTSPVMADPPTPQPLLYVSAGLEVQKLDGSPHSESIIQIDDVQIPNLHPDSIPEEYDDPVERPF